MAAMPGANSGRDHHFAGPPGALLGRDRGASGMRETVPTSFHPQAGAESRGYGQRNPPGLRVPVDRVGGEGVAG